MKYFIVGMHGSGKQELFDILSKQNITCGKLFSNVKKANKIVGLFVYMVKAYGKN